MPVRVKNFQCIISVWLLYLFSMNLGYLLIKKEVFHILQFLLGFIAGVLFLFHITVLTSMFFSLKCPPLDATWT